MNLRTFFFCLLLALVPLSKNMRAETASPQAKTSGPFDDILLVVHYNHAFYKTMGFIKNLYSSFPNIVFYGETPHSSLAQSANQYAKDVIQIPTHEGYYFSRVVADALERFPKYRGYIFLQDDVLMNFWNYTRLNKDKIWLAISFYNVREDTNEQVPSSWNSNFDKSKARNEFFNPVRDTFWWGRFHASNGLPALNPMMTYLEPKDRKFLAQNLGMSGRVGMVCDMFYLPQKVRKEAIRLSHLFKDVFCEISIPMMLVCLDNLQNWEFLRGVWNFSLESPKGLSHQNDADWIHPLKFSSTTYQNFAQDIVRRNTHANP